MSHRASLLKISELAYGQRVQLIHFKKSVPNFGDDLNRDIWPQLAPQLFASDADGRGFVGIGTIIGMQVGSVERLEVFSSGAGYDPVANWRKRDVQFHCVRGPLTARLLELSSDRALTDGAILSPLAPGLPDRASGGGGTIVIPHFETLESPGWPQACAAAGFELVDPRETPALVIERIAAADLVLTESLHGAILADTYGVPWIAFATSGNFSRSKWRDWTLSLDLPLEFTPVPPPSVAHVLRFGKSVAPHGVAVRVDEEEAFAEFTSRVATVATRRNGMKQLAKGALRRSPRLHPLLGYSASRTAEALAALARQRYFASAPATRERLRDAMLSRLKAVRA